MRPSPRHDDKKNRSGTILVLAAILMVPMIACLAFAVDIGYLCVVRTQLQLAADAAALAAASALYEPDALVTDRYYLPPETTVARYVAQNFVRFNTGGKYGDLAQSPDPGKFLQVDLNDANNPQGDIVLGRLNNPANIAESLTPDADSPNSVRVRVPRTKSHANGPVSLFFAPVLRISTSEVTASAVATVDYPSLLPFTTADRKWDELATGGDGDDYAYDDGAVKPGSDGTPELQIFPDSNWNGNGLPPGNFGSLQIGPQSGTGVLRQQIDAGPSTSDLAYHGGALDANMQIPGETGVKADVKTAYLGGNADGREYAGILGKPRYMALYDHAEGNGSNCQFTISKFVAVRVMAVNMTGSPKSIVVQPIEEFQHLLNVHLTR